MISTSLHDICVHVCVCMLACGGVSSVLKSPDGNWIALQSAQLSRPSLLTKRKSLVYSALEQESGVVSAYEGLGSDNESKPEPDSSWGAVLQEFHRKMTDSNLNMHDNKDRIPLTGCQGSIDGLFSDSEGSRKPKKPLHALLKRKLLADIRRPSSSHRTSIIDVNFNLEGAGEDEEEMRVAPEPEVGKVRKSRKKRRNKKETVASSSVSDLNQNDNYSSHPSEPVTPDTLTSGATTPEPFDSDANTSQMDKGLLLNLQQQRGVISDSTTKETELNKEIGAGNDKQMKGRIQESKDREEEDEKLWTMEIELDEEEKEIDEEMKYRLYSLVAQSRLSYFSSTDDELGRAGQSEGEWDRDEAEDMEEEDTEQEKTEGLTYKLCQLEKQVRASQFSSTEDELDRLGVEEKEGEEEEDENNEELAVKLCRLANQVNATEFSSTEDELDRVGIEGEETIDDESLWKLPAEEAAQLRDLVSLVSASQFSSTEDELDRLGENEGEMEKDVNEGQIESSFEMEEPWERAAEGRRESIGDLDVKMFELRDDIERSDEKVICDNYFNNQIQAEAVPHDETEVEETKDCVEERVMGNETIAKGQVCDEKVDILKGDEAEKEPDELKTGTEAESAENTVASNTLHKPQVQQENRLEAKWPDQEREDKFQKESIKNERKRETTEDSDEEEFERIISSMLLMTLEDVHGEKIKDTAGGRSKELEDEETYESNNTGSRENVGPSTVSSDEIGSFSKESQSQSDNQRPKSEVEKQPEENKSDKTDEHISSEQKGADITCRAVNEQKERQKTWLKEKTPAMTIIETFETNEAKLTCKTVEDEKEDGSEKLAAEWQALETRGDTTDYEKTDMDGRLEQTKERLTDMREQSSTSSLPEGLLSPEEIQSGRGMELYKTIEFISTLLEQRYSAVSLRSITTEVLKVLNATEELLQGVEGGENTHSSYTSLPPNADPKKLDQQFSRLEENVYVAAGSVYSLETELSDLEECARGISSSTSDMELSFLEDQVAAAAAKVQQSELQISDISARIAALRSAGLNVDTQSRLTKNRTIPIMPATLDSSRQLRRRLPAPPVKDKET